jgi:hypothetical protein
LESGFVRGVLKQVFAVREPGGIAHTRKGIEFAGALRILAVSVQRGGFNVGDRGVLFGPVSQFHVMPDDAALPSHCESPITRS